MQIRIILGILIRLHLFRKQNKKSSVIVCNPVTIMHLTLCTNIFLAKTYANVEGQPLTGNFGICRTTFVYKTLNF